MSLNTLPAAVSGPGLHAERLDGLHGRRRGVTGMMDRLDEVAGTALLYRSTWNLHPRLDHDCAAVAALCEALAIRIDRRRRLLVPGLVRQLLDDLEAHPLRPVPVRSGLRDATIETLLALKRLGYVHRFEGRPLPDEAQPDPDEVIGKVAAEVATNPYGSQPDEASVSALVHRHYLDVTPWPFHAAGEAAGLSRTTGHGLPGWGRRGAPAT